MQTTYNKIGSRSVISHRLKPLFVASLLTILSGCSLVNEDLPVCAVDESDDSNQILLQFTMESGAILSDTRTDDYHDETDSEWPAFEDQINLQDLGLFIFFGNETTAPLIAKNTSISSSSDPTEMITGANGYYTITMNVERDEIDDRLSELKDDAQSIDLRILILANCYSSGSDGGGQFNTLNANQKTNATEASTFSDVIDQANYWGFNISSEIHNSNDGDSQASGVWKGYIPMFGTNIFSVDREVLLSSTMGDMIELGTVNMLRALAKVRVEDNIANKVGGLPRISEVSVRSQTNMAYSLPANAIDYNDGQQVHSARVHYKSDDNIITYSFKLGTLSDGSSTRIGYIPEQSIATNLPAFYIKVLTKEATTTTNAEYQEYVVPMSGYGGEDFKFDEFSDGTNIPDILRNHIYTLSVEDVETGGPLTISLSVDDWVSTPVYELDYMDIPVVQTTIHWDEDTYSNDNTDAGELTILNFTEGNATAAVCTFNISRPLNGIWTATLIPANQFSDGAFEFEVENESGNYTAVRTVSGPIDGSDITLRIIGTNPSPAVTLEEYLQITVQLADGTIMEAKICPEDAVYSRYKIIQTIY